jgi:hypothetical protein
MAALSGCGSSNRNTGLENQHMENSYQNLQSGNRAEALFSGTMDELLKMAMDKGGRRMDGTSQPSIIIVQ